MTREHHYELALSWTGNDGEGTKTYRSYRRDHVVSAPGAPQIPGSSDPAFRGDPSRWNPEQLLVASLAQCHLLWYLHFAASAGVVVVGYEDAPTGTMVEDAAGGGRFSEVTLRPRVTVAAGTDPALAASLHAKVGDVCFIARSVNFPVRHDATVAVTG
ncbi:OsmC family protein [Agromyces silvae]|uniref:OsmC family protein n=1 Tax=Agromyces silvae TaxID=3388266 RepID=UPI00280C0935|nr:OsmC family protein [Agromyces protaetiae]